MFKKQHLALAIAATLAAGTAQAALETSVTLKNETAYMVKDGLRTGEATSTTDTTGEGKGVYKFENTAKIYLNDELDNGMSWHGELNIVRDTKAIDDYKGHDSYTQRDWLRELYVDTTVGDWDLRLGKQQVVWGTADGIKLLDMINPTDWSEFNQNTMADARIPVWMINAEKYLDNGANVQFVISQAKESKIAGLNDNGDQGHPFIMKGVDTLTGDVNGFRNIGNTLPAVAGTFNTLAVGFLAPSLAPFSTGTVNGFVTGTGTAANFGGACPGYGVNTNNSSGSRCLEVIAESTNLGSTNLISAQDATDDANASGAEAEWRIDNPTSTFEYLPNTSFGTFNTFSGDAGQGGTKANASTEWVYDLPDDLDSNVAFRFKNTTSNGLNYSFNYAYRYDSNPNVAVSWHNARTGAKLETELRNPDANSEAGGAVVARADVPTSVNALGTNAVIVLLKDPGTTNYYGAGVIDPTDGNTTLSADAVKMRFTESLNRNNSFGAAFDYALDTANSPIVLRGEFLYEKDSTQVVMDRKLMAIGDFEGAFTTQNADYVKYVIGADTTVMTDMMLSGQFIQFRNLDYVNEDRGGCQTQSGVSFSCNKYTADMSTMSLTNGFQQAEENKNFYSLFLSKPFGDSGEGRWNNIFIYEEGGGKWNRFDVEYGFDDQLIGTFEVNKYFGDENTMFGQFENASNVQIGVKYLLQ